MNYKQFMPGKVTAADYKFVEAHVLEHMSEGDKRITNPWSGDSATVNPLIAALYLMIEELQNGMLEKYGLKPTNWVSKFDRARMLILKLDSKIYMDFVD